MPTESHERVKWTLLGELKTVLTARLESGARLIDASDFARWLFELADKAEGARTKEVLQTI